MHKKRILKFFRNTVSVVLALSMLISNMGTGLSTVHAQEATQTVEAESEAAVSEETVNAASDYGLADNIQDGVILHCFDWKYNDIKAELKNIAEAGFTSVQTSPAQRDDGFSEWYYLYQPQGFAIASNPLGTKEELKALCDEAHKYGIKIVVDVIGNHTRGMDGHNGPIDDNLKKEEFFRWNNRSSSDMSSDDWNNRYLVTHCNVGMRDLVTENTELQDIIAGYLAELKGVGVDGIRWDTAKHIGLPSEDGSQFWPKMAAQGLYQYGEILEGPSNATDNEDIKKLMKEYTEYMSVTDNNYGSKLCGDFRDGKVPSSTGVWNAKGISSNKLVYWGESHDTYCNDTNEGGWTKYLDQNIIDRAYAIAASRADASALYYSRPFETEKTKIKAGAKGSTHFTAKEVAEVNKLHNNSIGERDYYVAGSDAAAVCRESGAVIVKASGSGNVSVANGGGLTKPGTYTDRVSGGQWTVTSSTISGPVGSSGIAVIYEEKTTNPSVTASVADGSSFTTDTLDVTFTVKNAKSATYSVDGGAETAFTDSVKLTLGADTAFGKDVVVNITLTAEDGSITSPVFTYTKKEAGKLEKNTVYFTKPSSWSSAKIYAYEDGTTVKKITGEWPGTAMKDEGEGVYSYTFESSVSACKVIFTDGTNQTPKDEEGKSCGYDYVAGKAYTYSEADGWKGVPVSEVTNTPVPTNTTAPTATTAPTEIKINTSLEDGSSFSTETQTVKLTLENAEKGTYSVDNGPVKEFTGTADVVIGKGKIADSTVTVKVTAEGNGKTVEKTFSYTKEYTALYSNPTVNSGAEEEAAVEEVVANAAPETTYATNPSGQVGTKKTITSVSDFTEDMIIAQGVANDDPAGFKGTHEAPKYDLYAMYGAWDDTNLYVGIQYTNVIDVVDPAQNAPQQDRGKPYSEDGDIPQMLVFDTGTGDYTDGTANDTEQKTAWDIDVKYSGDAKVDKLFLYSPKRNIVNQALFPVTGGIVDYTKIEKTGYHYVNTEKGEKYSDYSLPGVSITWEDGFFGSHMYGINKNGYQGYVPADLEDSSADWVDFLTTSHDTKHDTFCIVTIPLELLGTTAADVQNNGIGVMSVATYGASGIGSLPMDMTMLDVATESFSQDDSTSAEKEDEDIVTTALARLGGKAGPGPTRTPTRVPTPTTAGPTAEPTAEPTPIQGGDLDVNFGADRSAPQYNSTALEIKAIVNGGTAPYSYEFFVDNTSVQKSDKNTYTWQYGLEGAHTIKVVVTDSTGKTVTATKDYDLEKDADAPTPTAGATPTTVPVNTATPSPTNGAASRLTLTKFFVSCRTTDGRYKIGDTYVLRAESAGAQGTARYMFSYVLNGEEVIVRNYIDQSEPMNEASFVATEPGTYTFKVYVVDESNNMNPCFETGEVEILDVPDLTIAPSVTPAVTEKPVISVMPTSTPVPTKKPVVTETPVITGEPVATATPVPNTTEKGDKVTDKASKATYKVTATGSSKTVEYTGYTGTSTTVNIPSTININGATYKVTSVADKAFKGNKKLKVIKISANVTKIGKEAFSGCTSLSSVKEGKNITVIGDKAFYNCKKLSSITLSKKLTTIGKSAFYKCTSLKKITLNSKVSKIGSKAFYGCKNLKDITIKTTKLTSKNVGSSAFKGISSKAVIKAPSSKLKSYKKILKSKGVGSKAIYKKA